MAIPLSIDMGKIDKSLLKVVPLQNGGEGKFLKYAIFPNKEGVNENGQAGYIVQDIGKERREAGEQGPIIGNVTLPKGSSLTQVAFTKALTGDIDLNKVSEKLLKVGKERDNGTRGVFLNAVLVENRQGRDGYGNDGRIEQSIPREAREAGTRAPILGNFKAIDPKAQAQEQGKGQSQANERKPRDLAAEKANHEKTNTAEKAKSQEATRSKERGGQER